MKLHVCMGLYFCAEQGTGPLYHQVCLFVGPHPLLYIRVCNVVTTSSALPPHRFNCGGALMPIDAHAEDNSSHVHPVHSGMLLLYPRYPLHVAIGNIHVARVPRKALACRATCCSVVASIPIVFGSIL